MYLKFFHIHKFFAALRCFHFDWKVFEQQFFALTFLSESKNRFHKEIRVTSDVSLTKFLEYCAGRTGYDPFSWFLISHTSKKLSFGIPSSYIPFIRYLNCETAPFQYCDYCRVACISDNLRDFSLHLQMNSIFWNKKRWAAANYRARFHKLSQKKNLACDQSLWNNSCRKGYEYCRHIVLTVIFTNFFFNQSELK